jgi:hypothetical protein
MPARAIASWLSVTTTSGSGADAAGLEPARSVAGPAAGTPAFGAADGSEGNRFGVLNRNPM